MKKIIFCISTFFIICLMTVSLIKAYRYYAPPKERIAYKMRLHDDTIRIAYIGDSWAYIHQRDHQCHISITIQNQCKVPTKIYSYGFPGRTSKEIYEAIFDDKEQRRLLQDFGFQYCIISAGINDANKKMGSKYYQKSMEYIIRFLLLNHVRPIIIEMPDYDILKTYRWQKANRKILYKLSMAINKVPVDCKQIYRDALDELIHNKGYQEKVSIIRYKSWNNDYEKDQKILYLTDGIHLNEYGNAVLDSFISKEIIRNIDN